MDAFFRPILLSALITVMLNTVFVIPIMGMPLLTFFASGFLACYFYRRENREDEYKEIKVSEAALLGLGTGVIVGAVLAYILCTKMQDPEMQETLINTINDGMKMRGDGNFEFVDSLGSAFYVVTGAITIFMISAVSFFGSVASLPFLNKPKK